MDILQAIQERHSVRHYFSKEIEAEKLAALRADIDQYNHVSNAVRFQLITSEPKAFSGLISHYGNFSGVQNYIAIICDKGTQFEELAGYYGEKLVLKAQMLGLNTCWVALTFSKKKTPVIINRGERLLCVITLGYGVVPGKPHKNRPMEEVYETDGTMPDWFERGMQAAMLAPTATNQQSFYFTLRGSEVLAEATGGFYCALDLGIVKCHFEIGAGPENFTWAQASEV